MAIWSPPLQIWHPLDMVDEDDATKFGTFLLKKLTSFFGSTPQIQLGNLQEVVSIEISHFTYHSESLRPVIYIFMVTSPKQFIHSLGTGHFAKCSIANQNRKTSHNTWFLRSQSDDNKIDQLLNCFCSCLIFEKNKHHPSHYVNSD